MQSHFYIFELGAIKLPTLILIYPNLTLISKRLRQIIKQHFKNLIHAAKQSRCWQEYNWLSRAIKSETLFSKQRANLRFLYSVLHLKLDKLLYCMSGDFLFLNQSRLLLRAFPWQTYTISVQHFLHIKIYLIHAQHAHMLLMHFSKKSVCLLFPKRQWQKKYLK